MDAPPDSDENHVRSRAPVFGTPEHAVDQGWHEWEANHAEAGQGAEWHALGSFKTTIIV